MAIQDRIKDLRRVKACELHPNPNNWRTHPKHQQEALRGVLEEIGYADALLARELDDGSLQLIDGHLRAETTPDEVVPVLVLDVSESEAEKLLVTLDPLAAMATADAAKLEALLRDVQTGSEAVADMLTDLAASEGAIPKRLPTDPANDPNEEWEGMPEYEHEDKSAYQSIHVHFKDEACRDEFAAIIGQKLTENTRSIWYPQIEIETYADKEYVTDES